MDMVVAIKHAYENADQFGIDKNKIALGGESGGGLVVMATGTQLAVRKESGYIKLIMPEFGI